MTKWSKSPDQSDELAQLMASDDRFAASVDAFKASVSAPIDAEVSEMQITQIVRAAEKTGRSSSKGSFVRRLSLGSRLALVSAILTGAMGSMAYAGVLPAQMQDAISKAAAKAGFHLPASAHSASNSNTGDNTKSVSGDVHNVLDQDLKGREKGQQVSDTASQNRQNSGVPTSTATTHPTSKRSTSNTNKCDTHKP